MSDAELKSPGDGHLNIVHGDKDDTVSETRTCGSGPAAETQPHKRLLNHMNNSGDVEAPEELSSKKFKMSLCLPFEKVVFIDATWNQTHNIVTDERLKSKYCQI